MKPISSNHKHLVGQLSGVLVENDRLKKHNQELLEKLKSKLGPRSIATDAVRVRTVGSRRRKRRGSDGAAVRVQVMTVCQTNKKLNALFPEGGVIWRDVEELLFEVELPELKSILSPLLPLVDTDILQEIFGISDMQRVASALHDVFGESVV